MNLRERRGAITVMAGVSMVCLAFFGAIAIDTTRVFTSRAELQTVVDAAALAGAIQMLRDSSVAVDTALAYARRNGLRLTGDQADTVAVTTGVWSNAAGAFVPGADPADALRVRVTRRVNFLLAQMVGGAGVSLSASATSWASAPVNGSRGCIKPIALPYDFVRRVVNPPSADMTPDDMRRLRELSQGERADSFLFGDRNDPSAGRYYAVDLPPVLDGSGQRTETPQGSYQQYLGACKTTRVGAGDWLLMLPQGGRRQATVNGVRDLCQAPVDSGGMGGSFSNGSCFVNGTETGIPMKVAFWDDAPAYDVFSLGAVQVKALGSFTLTHINDTVDPTTGLARATISGYLTTQRDFGEVGSGASTLRRAVIVQ